MKQPITIGVLSGFTPEQEAANGSREFDIFVDLFSRVDHPFTFTEYRITEGDFPSPSDCDAYLITGSPADAYGTSPWVLRLREFILSAYSLHIPMVGICFGHQVLAHTLGGRTENSKKGWGFGRGKLNISAPQTWMSPAREQCDLHYFHQDQVMELPPNATRIGGTDHCPNGMFVIGKSVFGVQAHPEMPDERVTKNIEFFRQGAMKADPSVPDRAEKTLKKGIADGAIVAQWIVNFLRQNEKLRGSPQVKSTVAGVCRPEERIAIVRGVASRIA